MKGRKRAYLSPIHLSFEGIKKYEKIKQAKKKLASFLYLNSKKNQKIASY